MKRTSMLTAASALVLALAASEAVASQETELCPEKSTDQIYVLSEAAESTNPVELDSTETRDVCIRGGSQDVKVISGSHDVKVIGDWGGSYTGSADGADTITVTEDGVGSGAKWSLLDGNNTIKGSGSISAAIVMGEGDDTIGIDPEASSGSLTDTQIAAANSLSLRGKVSLGGGSNKVFAKELSLGASLTGGSGSDEIHLTGKSAGVIDLGDGAGNNTLTVLGIASGNVNSAATGTDTVSIGGGAGDVSLGDGTNVFTVNTTDWTGFYTDGLNDDTITIASGARITNTIGLSLFLGSNTIRGAGAVLGPIAFGSGDDKVGGKISEAEYNDLSLASIDLGGGTNTLRAKSTDSITGGSGIDEVFVTGAVNGKIDLKGGTKNVLEVSGTVTGDVISAAVGTGKSMDMFSVSGVTGKIDLGGGDNQLEISGKVTGTYGGSNGGGSGVDMITVTSSGNISSATVWNLGSGDDVLRGEGTVKTSINLGNGNDTVGGNLTEKTYNGLSLASIDLGGGANTLRAKSTGSITGGSGIDEVFVTGAVNGKIDLKGGTKNVLEVSGTITGDVISTAAGTGKSMDMFSVSGVTGKIDLGGGDNQLEISGTVKGAYGGANGGGSGVDVITVTSSGTISSVTVWNLGLGDDVLRGQGTVETSINLGGGNDTVGGKPAQQTYNGLSLASIDLGGGANTLRAKSTGSITGGSGIDEVFVTGAVKGTINLKGGAKNVLEVSGTVTGDVISTAVGTGSNLDVFSVDGVTGKIDLGGGDNQLTVSGTISGSYDGGDGVDTVIVKSLGTLSAGVNWNLGSKNDVLKGSGNVLASVYMGPGNDIVGGSFSETDSNSLSLASLYLGSGNNTVRAVSATTITAGSGNDSIFLTPSANFALGTLNLGGGNNTLRIAGRSGDPSARQATISLSGGPKSGAINDSLVICNEIDSVGECKDVATKTDHAFNVKLYASGANGNTWESVTVSNFNSSQQSLLGISGSVTIKNPKLNNLMVVHNGVAGDTLTLTKTYEFRKYTNVNKVSSGTLFELDVDTSPTATASDLLKFDDVKTADASDLVSIPTIRIKPLNEGDTIKPNPDSRLNIMTLESADIERITVLGLSNSLLTLNGYPWEIGVSTESGVTTVFFTPYMIETKTVGGSGNINMGSGRNKLTLTSNWSGNYTGGDGPDTIMIGSYTASGTLKVGGGANSVTGTGKVNVLTMGDGDDDIGIHPGGSDYKISTTGDNPTAKEVADSNGLTFTGKMTLGNGQNVVYFKALSGGSIMGGESGIDWVNFEGGEGDVNLGGGDNYFFLTKGPWKGNYTGGKGIDYLKLDGDVTGDLVLGSGGSNHVILNGNLTGDVTFDDAAPAGSSLKSGSPGGWTPSGTNDVSIGGGTGNITLGGAKNHLRLSGDWGGAYTGLGGTDIIDVGSHRGLGSAPWNLGIGPDIIRGSGSISAPVNMGSGDDMIGGAADSEAENGLSLTSVSLGSGSNVMRAAGVESLTAGAGNDRIVLRPRESFSLGQLDLGMGTNRLFVSGGAGSLGDLNSRKVSLSLSGGSAGASNDWLYICNEGVSDDWACADQKDGNHAFNVVLDASGSGGNSWEKIHVVNKPSKLQSTVTVKGKVTLQDPELNNLRVAGDGIAGDTIAISGTYGITPSTIFELDFDAGKGVSDILVFDASARKRSGKEFTSKPVIQIKAASLAGDTAAASRIEIAKSGSSTAITGVQIQGATNGRIDLNGQSWELKSESAAANGEVAYFLESTPAESSKQAQPGGATSGQIASVANGAAAWIGGAANQAGSGIGSGPGVSQSRGFLPEASVWTHFTVGSESGRMPGGIGSEYQHSFQFLSSEVDLFVQGNQGSRLSHFMTLQYGAIEAGDSLRSTLSSIGYGLELVNAGESFFAVSASMSEISSEDLSGLENGQKQIMRGLTFVAEAGREVQMSERLSLSEFARLTQTKYGAVSFSDGSSLSDFRKLSGDLGFRLDYALAQPGSSEQLEWSHGNLYGGAALAHDFESGYVVSGKDGDSSVDTGKNWVNIDAGLSWGFGNSLFFVEMSAGTVVDGPKANRKALSIGYDLSW